MRKKGMKDDEMWVWFYSSIIKMCNASKVNMHFVGCHVEPDDVTQNILMWLTEHYDKAIEIYESRSYGFLKELVKKELYLLTSMQRFSINNQKPLFTFQKIEDTCVKYHIEFLPENAYKIAALIDRNDDMTIWSIAYMMKNQGVAPCKISTETLGDVV